MVKDRLSRKGLVVAVILLFIGLIFNPIIVAEESKTDNLVDLNIDICGISGGKQTIRLAQEEFEEVESLIDLTGRKLNKTESTFEAKKILYDALGKLKKYNLFSDLSINQVQELFESITTVQGKDGSSSLGIKQNTNCIIAGRVTNAFFIGHVLRFLCLLINPFLLSVFIMGFPFFPLRAGASITLGSYYAWVMEWVTNPSEGWIVTSGSNGTKKWIGELLGDIDYIDVSFIGKKLLYVGIDGFFGLKIYNPVTGKTSILGYARNVKIESGWIDEIKHPLLFFNVVNIGKSRLFRFDKLWKIAFDSEYEGIINTLILLRSLWLYGTVQIWIKLWNNLSDKYNWNWSDLNNYIY